MTTIEAVRLIGPGVDRVDGPLKVTGSAPYPGDFSFANMAHAVLVRATVAAGRIRRIEAAAAEAAPGVLAVITHRNAPKLERGPDTPAWRQPPPPLQDNRILHYGQYIGVVVAETAEQATAAARLIETDYEPTEPLLDLDDPRAEVLTNPWGLDAHRGDLAAGLASADVTVEATYTTPDETNNPMGLFATVAFWDGDSLTVHDSNQWPHGVRATLAAAFGVPESGVRVLTPFVGGGFGAGLRVWPHVVLTALAARTAGRPVKLVLTRPQMFTGIGHRTRTVQHIRLGADRSGHLTALDHEAKASITVEDETYEPVAADSATAYACPNADTRDSQARLNIPNPTFMRAPGEAQGNFALESWTSSPMPSGWTRSSCGCATTPRTTRSSACRGRARRCAPATSRAPSGSAGGPATRGRARCATGAGWWVTAWPASASSGSRCHARRARRSGGTGPRSCAAPRPTSAPAPTP